MDEDANTAAMEELKPDPATPIDPTMIKSREAVKKAKADNSGRVYRVYCDGIFDLCHIGHMNLLKQAKHMLGKPEKTYLLVGVCSDKLTRKYKGKTVIDHKNRCDTVSHVRWCDQVVPEAPWVLPDSFLEKYKIDFVAHDALPYVVSTADSNMDMDDVYVSIKAKGMFMETQRTEGVSTSDLIVSIVKDYDLFIKQNLQKGYTKEQLAVGKTWEMRTKLKVNKEKLSESIDKTKQEWIEFKSMAKEFGREFNPRANSFQLRQLKKNLKDPYKRVKSHGTTLRKSVWISVKDFLWYINPFGYFSKKNILIIFLGLYLAFMWQYFLYTYVPKA